MISYIAAMLQKKVTPNDKNCDKDLKYIQKLQPTKAVKGKSRQIIDGIAALFE
ncbi:MAG: hypothetical protein ACLR6O_08920 [Eubacterium sp.]